MVAGELYLYLCRDSESGYVVDADTAAASGRLEAVHELLNAGADANAANEKGQTPL